jgi:aconitate hydratase
MFLKRYEEIYGGDNNWKSINSVSDTTYTWNASSTYIKHPPFFANDENEVQDIVNARILALLGDSVTTDHISPAGAIKLDSPAGKYLNERQISRKDFNSYGSRRGNHEIMMRGTFANIRIKNEIIPGTEGGITKFFDGNENQMSIYDAATKYAKKNIPLVIFAGKEYGTGSSRDWAAKGTKLLGVRAVIAESFERIHRSNLIGMGVLPLQFTSDQNRKSLNLIGDEIITIKGLNAIKPNEELICEINSKDKRSIKLLCRIDTNKELDYYKQGGILQYVLNSIIKKAS